MAFFMMNFFVPLK